MAIQNISYVLPDADVQEIKAAFQTIRTKLPFLINLSDDESKSLFRLGPKSADFTIDARDTANNFPQILPSTFQKVELVNDSTLFSQMGEIKLLSDSLSEQIKDTYDAVGAEAMSAALEVYAYVQVNENKVPGLKSVAEKLRERFKKFRNRKSSDQAKQ